MISKKLNVKSKSIKLDERKEISSFVDNIKVKQDFEKQNLLKLQHEYEKGVISEKDMTYEQICGIERLYIEQISRLQEEFNNYKRKANSLRKKY